MPHADRPLIVGAGPVGLAAALFLARSGRPTRIVEARAEPSTESKALAVNPRTLTILEPTGVTRQMLDMGQPIRGAHFHQSGRIVATLGFQGIHPKYPFLLALSQATTERLLARALSAAGGTVERKVRLAECRNIAGGVEAILEPTDGGPRERTQAPWLLGADGARSTVRDQMQIGFPGSSLANEWYLADVPLKTDLVDDHGHIFLLDEGVFLFMIRVIDDATKDRSRTPIWRIITNRPDPLSRLVEAEPAGPAIWTSAFHIAHRIGSTFSAGNVFLAGDAAHIHSPLGARGMNLGIEDAYVFAELLSAGRMADYDRLRRPTDRTVMRMVRIMTRIASADTWFHRLVRTYGLPRAIRIPFIRKRMLATATGLDHELIPPLAAQSARNGF